MSTLLVENARGPEVVVLKSLLREWGKQNPLPKFADTPVYGPATVAAVRAFQTANGLEVDGKVGGATWAALRKLTGAPRQLPPLPSRFAHPEIPPYVRASGAHGLQPWIAPQVEAICNRFGLRVTEGFGGHPPHAVRSDHGWGGGVDLAGPMEAMVACNLWANDLCADPYREGKVFRWVGGPAKDSSGVEPGHHNHVHLSWYRGGPATSVFDTPGFD